MVRRQTHDRRLCSVCDKCESSLFTIDLYVSTLHSPESRPVLSVQLKLTRLIRVIQFSISHVLTKCSLPVLYCQYQSTTPDQTRQPGDSGECLKKVNNTNKYVYCLIVYPKTENRNRKPVGGLSKTENPVFDGSTRFCKPYTAPPYTHKSRVAFSGEFGKATQHSW